MKKTILTALAATGLSIAAFGQGSLSFTDVPINPGVATDNASAWVTGTMSFSIWWMSGTSDTSVINSINAADLAGGGGASAATLTADGFTSEFSGSVAVNSGTFTYNANGIALPNITTSVNGTFAILASVGGNLFGSIAFVNPDGGNIGVTPAGTPANLTGWNTLAQNLVLTPVPEPTTLALAGLGAGALMMFRRRK